MSIEKIVAEFISRIDIFSISSKIAIRGPFTYMAQLQSQHGLVMTCTGKSGMNHLSIPNFNSAIVEILEW